MFFGQNKFRQKTAHYDESILDIGLERSVPIFADNFCFYFNFFVFILVFFVFSLIFSFSAAN